MTLRGAVDAFPLGTVLQLLADTGKTGQLEVRSEDGRAGTLGVSKGRLVSAQFEDENGPLALGAIFTFQRGSFEFVPVERIDAEDLAGELVDLLDRAAAERDHQIGIRELVADEQMRFELSERAAERAEIKLSAEQWRALLAVDGQRDVHAIAEQLQIRRLAALDLLAGLVRAGMIDPVEPGEGEERRVYRPLRPMPPLPPTHAGEPIVLRGATGDFPLETILQLLAHTRKTGRLEVRDEGEGSTLGVADGRLVSAAWAEEAGELALGAAFTAERGEFDFIPMAEAPSANLVGDLDDLLERAAGTRDRIVAIRGLVPNERVRFKLSDRATQHAEITLTSDEWRALLAVNGERDVLAIAEHLHVRRLPAMVILADLIEGGLIDVLPAPEAPAEAEAAAEEPAAAPLEEAPAAGAGAPLAETPLEAWAPPITEVPPPPPSWDTTMPAWGPAPAEAAEAEPAPPEPAIDPRLAAFGLETAPAEAAPTEPATAEPAPLEPAVDPRLAVFGAPPAEPEAPAWEPAAPAAPAETWPPAAEPSVVEERPATEVRPLEEEPEPATAEPAVAQAISTAAAAPVVIPEKKRKGLFGGLFGGRADRAAPPAAAPQAVSGARTRAGQLAIFVNELLAGYNSGQYGRGRVEDRMLGLLMRVDEQADPIDRPVPVLNDRLDVGEIDEEAVPERQALPYLAMLIRQIYEDAERAFGRGQAKRGFRDVRARLFGKDLALFQAPEVAGRVPKV